MIAQKHRRIVPLPAARFSNTPTQPAMSHPATDARVRAVFALASRAGDFKTASPDAVAIGMRVTFAVAATLIVVALVIALGSLARSRSAHRSRASV